MRTALILALPLVASLLVPPAAAAAQLSNGQTPAASTYKLGCLLAGGTGAFPDLVITNIGAQALGVGQSVHIAFASGIRFALILPQALAAGANLATPLPDTVNGIPSGACAAGLG